MNTNTWTGFEQGTSAKNINVTSANFDNWNVPFYIMAKEDGDIKGKLTHWEDIVIPVLKWNILPLQFSILYSTGTTIPTSLISIT